MSAHNNYEVYQEAKCDLGLVDIVDALDYIKTIAVYIPSESKLKDYYEDVIRPLEIFAKACSTDKVCPKCGRNLYVSDLEDYEYVCAYCNENFYETEIKEDIKEEKEMKKYTLENYKEFCEEALICPPFEDDKQIDEWLDTHKIQIIANDCVMELDYDADAVNEIDFSLREIHRAILGDGEATTGNTVGSEYRPAELKDLVRFFILRECENWGNLDWIGYAERAVKELSDIKTISEVWNNALETRQAWIDILKCNFEKFNLATLKDATKDGIKKIILDLVGSDVEVSYDPHTDKSFIIDYTFSETGIFLDWSWGKVDDVEVQNMLAIYKEGMF